MERVNWGIIGTGNIANSFARDFAYAHGGNLFAVASRSVDQARIFKEAYGIQRAYGSYEELLEAPEVDVVYITTPHNFHFEISRTAIKNGKAVLCEKPITVDPAQCRELIALSRANKVFLMEAMWTCFLPPILKMKEWLIQGRIGKVRYLRAEFGIRACEDPKSRLFNPDLAGGALLDIGIYPVALTWLVFNQMPQHVAVNSKLSKRGVDIEETMIFQYPDESLASLNASFNYSMPNEALIVGEDGYIKIPEFFMARKCLLYSEHGVTERFTDQRNSVGYAYEINEVNKCLTEGRLESEIMPLQNSLKIQEIMDIVKDKF
ncbi:MAG: Gfo/Idh/MocA family oxidoreductase [Cytophagales bacterium]|nr:Gfo/Idh/MocA family oxidoreductase [Cytophagales bacterium]